jgi:hypothetical protein
LFSSPQQEYPLPTEAGTDRVMIHLGAMVEVSSTDVKHKAGKLHDFRFRDNGGR